MDGSLAAPIRYAAFPPCDNPHVLIVSTYVRGVTRGQGMGTAGYSYEVVRALFLPVLRRWGDVIFVNDASVEVERVGAQLRAENRRPIHVGIIACQDMYISPTMPNIVVPAWEFPDVPAFALDGNPRNDWVAMSNRCDMVFAHVPFTANSLIGAGVTTPVREVPVPIPEPYFQVPPHQLVDETTLSIPGIGLTDWQYLPFLIEPTRAARPALPPAPTLGTVLRKRAAVAARRRCGPGARRSCAWPSGLPRRPLPIGSGGPCVP